MSPHRISRSTRRRTSPPLLSVGPPRVSRQRASTTLSCGLHGVGEVHEPRLEVAEAAPPLLGVRDVAVGEGHRSEVHLERAGQARLLMALEDGKTHHDARLVESAVHRDRLGDGPCRVPDQPVLAGLERSLIRTSMPCRIARSRTPSLFTAASGAWLDRSRVPWASKSVARPNPARFSSSATATTVSPAVVTGYGCEAQ